MAAEKAAPTQDIQVQRKIVVIRPTPDEEKEVYRVTYWSRRIPPRTLWIPKEEWTPKKEAEALRKDIKEREAEKAETVTL